MKSTNITILSEITPSDYAVYIKNIPLGLDQDK